MSPVTRYARSGEAMIAYQVLGDGPFDLVYMAGAASHVDVRWESARFSAFLQRLASFSRLILFDRRGSGASDPLPYGGRPTWEEWSEDLTAVLTAVGSEQAALFATIDAGPLAMTYAATFPERVRALVLANTSARLLVADDYPQGMTDEFADSFIELIESSWGTPEFARLSSPSVADESGWFEKYMRAAVTPRGAAMQMRALLPTDFRSVLPVIRVPTLVLHNKGFVFLGAPHGQYVADHIEGARFVELPSADSALLFDAADPALDTVEEFLTGAVHGADQQRMLATVVFTDVVDSTRRATQAGDRRWRDLLEKHDDLTRVAVRRHGGRVWKSTGDGAMATFDSPGRAIRSMVELQAELAPLDLPIRVGIHAGEVEVRPSDVSGLTVHIAARVLDEAGEGEVLISRTVADLCAGSGLALSERGSRVLKGVPGEWGLFKVESSKQATR